MSDDLRLGQNSRFNAVRFNQKKENSQQAEQNIQREEQASAPKNAANLSPDEVLNFMAQSCQVKIEKSGKTEKVCKKIEISKYVTPEQADRIRASMRDFTEVIFPTAVKELGSESLALNVLNMM